MTQSRRPKLDDTASALFRDAIPRNRDASRGTGLTDGGEAEATALGALLVWKLVQHGGCELPIRPAREAATKLVAALSEIQRHRLEREATEVLRWLEDSLSLFDPAWEDAEDRGIYPWDDREFPENGKSELIQAAIQNSADLEIEYFTYSRNALTRRRITPLELNGTSKLRALCHWRRDERHFLLRRIKNVRCLDLRPGL